MRLAVVGSTNVTLSQKSVAATIIKGFLWEHVPDEFISGGATGIDALAEACADLIGVPKKIYLPENNRWEPDGFKKRNIIIAKECDALLCIRSEQSTTYGSGWTADRAEEMGKTVWRVKI